MSVNLSQAKGKPSTGYRCPMAQGTCGMERSIESPVAPTSLIKAQSLTLRAGLLIAAVITVFGFRLPYGPVLSPRELLGIALERIFAVSVICTLAVFLLSPAALQKDKRQFTQFLRQASVTAIWIAPLTIFIQEDSLWTLAVAATFSVIVIRSCGTPEDPPGSGQNFLLSLLRTDELPLTSDFALGVSVAAALCLQIGILAGFGDHNAAGAVLVGLAFGAWAWSSNRNIGSSTSSRSDRAYLSRPLLALALVAGLMIAGLMPYLRREHGSGAIASGGAWFHFHRASGAVMGARTGRRAQVELHHPGSRGEIGIILWPEKKNVLKLVAPIPVTTSTAAGSGSANPLIIPFGGVYWVFKSPDLQPPEDSREAHESPDKVEIRSTDRRPLLIEAHDYLANLINLDCCSRMQVAIRNADRYPESVSLELIVANTSLPHHPSMSLGRMMVSSTPAWSLYAKRPTVAETLSFPISANRPLKSFDEVKIVFRLDQARADVAARIAIDHFVLIPRGL